MDNFIGNEPEHAVHQIVAAGGGYYEGLHCVLRWLQHKNCTKECLVGFWQVQEKTNGG
jgi:hypothetical protein